MRHALAAIEPDEAEAKQQTHSTAVHPASCYLPTYLPTFTACPFGSAATTTKTSISSLDAVALRQTPSVLQSSSPPAAFYS